MSNIADTCESVGLGYIPGNNNWKSYVGNIWYKIFSQYNLEKKGTLVEIAPGSVNKIGNGLKSYGFNGKLYVVEPNTKSLATIQEQYSQILPACIRPIKATLKKAIPILPEKVHAIIANHPLDDMIAGKYLDKIGFDEFFDDHYDSVSPDKTRELWRRIESDPSQLQAVKQEVSDEWNQLIERTNPCLIIISQYESYFFRSNNIPSPDKHAFDVLNEIRIRYSNSESNICLEEYVENPSRWLVLENPLK
ncbi:Uncharacterised protein [uncultured archaeon]|nr:Uncharacterised protein [uncultured archaeon]